MSFGKCILCHSVGLHASVCECKCAHPGLVVQTILINWLFVSFFFPFQSMPCCRSCMVGRPRMCCELAVPVPISSRFISLGQNQIKTLTHLFSTIYKCLPGAWESLAWVALPLLGLLGRCPVVGPPSLGNLSISGQRVLYDLPQQSVVLCLLACISQHLSMLC